MVNPSGENGVQDTVPREEFEQLRTLLQNVSLQQQQQNVANGATTLLQQTLQAFTTAQANQVVYTELAKTPLYHGDGTTSIDKWLNKVIGVIRQCSAPIELQSSLLLGRLTSDAACSASSLPVATKNSLSALTTALRERGKRHL